MMMMMATKIVVYICIYISVYYIWYEDKYTEDTQNIIQEMQTNMHTCKLNQFVCTEV